MTRRVLRFTHPSSPVHKLGPIWWLKRNKRMRKPPALQRALLRALKMQWWGNVSSDPGIPF